MYLPMIILLLVVLPLGSIIAELWVFHSSVDPFGLIGKWFAFWAIGTRLSIAGVMQILRPSYTAKAFFETEDAGARAVVQELGFGNLAIGLIGALSLFIP